MATEWRVGDLVWSKMKSYPWWPSLIAEPKKEVKKPASKKPMQFVWFFGTNNYGYISEDLIKPYEENKAKYSECHLPSFRAALLEVQKFVPSPKKGKIARPKDDSIKTNGVTPRKRSLQINHNKIKNKSVKRKTDSELGSIENSTKRRLSDTSSTSSTSNRVTSKEGRYLPLMSNLSPYLKFPSNSLPDFTGSTQKPKPLAALLNRRTCSEIPAYQPVQFSDKVKAREMVTDRPTGMKIGFLGIGIMGGGIVKNLIESGHDVIIWNRSREKVYCFQDIGIVVAKTPEDVVAVCDITFSCVSDPVAAKDIVFGNCGVLKVIRDGKGYVEITAIDPETSRDISEAITQKGGEYLEAPVLGSREYSLKGELIILAAGDSKLFDKCRPCFQAIGDHAFFLGEVGNASKMNLILNMIMGASLASLAEGMALAKRVNVSQSNLLEILELGVLNCSLLTEKAKVIMENKFPTSTPLQHMQKNLQLALQLGDQCTQPLSTIASANEVFKHARRLGYGEHDISAVYSVYC